MKIFRYISLALFLLGIVIMISLSDEDNMGLIGAAIAGVIMSGVGLLGLIIPTVIKPPKVSRQINRGEGIFAILVAVLIILSFYFFKVATLAVFVIVLLIAFAVYKFRQET